MMITMRGTDYETARLASAMKGHLAEQKAVIVFQPNEPGSEPSGHFMASWDVDDDATTANAKLKENGVTFHTLQPLDGGGVRIFVYGEDQESYDSVGRAAAAYQSKFEVVYGAGEFLGTTKEDGTDAEQRKDAQRVYEEAIGSAAGSGGRDVGAIWQDVRDHWSAAFGSKAEGSAAPGKEPSKGPDTPSGEGGVAGGDVDIEKDFTVDTGDSDQPIKTMDELYARSTADEAGFKAQIEEAAKVTGGRTKYAETNGSILKTRESAERKLKDPDVKGDPAKLRDILRATIINDTVQNTRIAAAKFIQENRDRIVRVKDRYANPLQEGYRDILINFKTESGIITELQFNSQTMLDTKMGEGHKLYEQHRAEKVKPNPDGQVLLSLARQQAQVYDSAYKRDGNGNWAKKVAKP